MFFDEHKREDVIKYQKTFFNKINSLLPYFVEFYEDNIMILKKYSHDCTIKKLDQRPIIIIINDKITFFANNGYKKV